MNITISTDGKAVILTTSDSTLISIPLLNGAGKVAEVGVRQLLNLLEMRAATQETPKIGERAFPTQWEIDHVTVRTFTPRGKELPADGFYF